MRIVKEHEERRNEILDTAEILFAEKGYENCAVNEILNRIGIAKGTFYHYFKSKEELLDAIIERTSNALVARANLIAEDEKLSPEDKLLHVFLGLRVSDANKEKLIEEMHKSENALMHQKSLASMINGVTPILVKVIEEGNEKGVFACEYPEQYMQIFICSASVLFDEGIFELEECKQEAMFIAMFTLMEQMLGVEKGMITKRAMKEYVQTDES